MTGIKVRNNKTVAPLGSYSLVKNDKNIYKRVKEFGKWCMGYKCSPYITEIGLVKQTYTSVRKIFGIKICLSLTSRLNMLLFNKSDF